MFIAPSYELAPDKVMPHGADSKWVSGKHRPMFATSSSRTMSQGRELSLSLCAQPVGQNNMESSERTLYRRVPGLTDDRENIVQLARFSAGLGNVERVDVLPFHQMGRFKWKELMLSYTLSDVQPPALEAVQHVCAQFRVEGLRAY